MSLRIVPRQSNIELFRIICMVIIVMGHFIQYGYFQNKMITLENINMEGIIVTELMQFARTACSGFALISGYFLIKGNYRFRKLVLLMIKIEIYSVILCCFFGGVYSEYYSITRYDLIKSFFPIVWGNWYVAAYVCFYPFTPFLNKGLLALTQKEFKHLIILFLSIWSLIPTLGYLGVINSKMAITNSWNYKFGSLSFFLIMYIIGAFIRLYGEMELCRNKYFYFSIGLINMIIMLGMVILNVELGIHFQNDEIFKNVRYFSEYTMVPSVLMSVSFFVFFTKIKIEKYCRIINAIASTTFGIYLIHIDNIAKHTIHRYVYDSLLVVDNVYLKVMIGIVLVFCICFVVDILYDYTIQKWTAYLLNRLIDNENCGDSVGA